eukprot:TRINITY_DN675_c4_g1_i2.p1 TRINITY_DN675_c4_g1~~TRINITY_DN675_c4_g1_i2.p1  ORF type:complete len:1463 (+),score=252.78 TRINITY_DN675_c4_g1_i2:90-4391(+)
MDHERGASGDPGSPVLGGRRRSTAQSDSPGSPHTIPRIPTDDGNVSRRLSLGGSLVHLVSTPGTDNAAASPAQSTTRRAFAGLQDGGLGAASIIGRQRELLQRRRTVRIHCLYVSRRLVRQGPRGMLRGGQVDRHVCLGPGLTASAEVMTAARVVKRHCSFDLRVGGAGSDSGREFQRLLDAVHHQMNIAVGVELDVRAVLESGTVVRITDDDQLFNVLQNSPDDLTIRVSKGGRKRYSALITILVSLVDMITTMVLAVHLLRLTVTGDEERERLLHICGWVLVVSVFLNAAINLNCAFLILKRAKAEYPRVASWVESCQTSVAVGCMLALFNLLNLECLWSNLTLFSFMNMHCPMPPQIRARTVRMSLYSLFVADVVPMAASLVEFFTSRKHSTLTLMSLITSAASVLCTLLKKTVVVLLVDEGGSQGEREDEIETQEDYNSALEQREVTVLRVQLCGFDAVQLRPSAIAHLLCRFHREAFRAIRQNNGIVLRFHHGAVAAVFNGLTQEEERDHATKAVRAALSLISTWANARAECFAEQGSHDRASITVDVTADTGPAHVGMLGTAMRREFQVVGPHWRRLSQLHALCNVLWSDDNSASSFVTAFAFAAGQSHALVSETCGVAAREPSYLRPIDRISPSASAARIDHYTVYEVLPAHSPVRELRDADRRAVPMWATVFAELTHGTVENADRALAKYLHAYKGTPDRLAQQLRERLKSAKNNKHVFYARYLDPHGSAELTANSPRSPPGSPRVMSPRGTPSVDAASTAAAVAAQRQAMEAHQAAQDAQAAVLRTQEALITTMVGAVSASSRPRSRSRRFSQYRAVSPPNRRKSSSGRFSPFGLFEAGQSGRQGQTSPKSKLERVNSGAGQDQSVSVRSALSQFSIGQTDFDPDGPDRRGSNDSVGQALAQECRDSNRCSSARPGSRGWSPNAEQSEPERNTGATETSSHNLRLPRDLSGSPGARRCKGKRSVRQAKRGSGRTASPLSPGSTLRSHCSWSLLHDQALQQLETDNRHPNKAREQKLPDGLTPLQTPPDDAAAAAGGNCQVGDNCIRSGTAADTTEAAPSCQPLHKTQPAPPAESAEWLPRLLTSPQTKAGFQKIEFALPLALQQSDSQLTGSHSTLLGTASASAQAHALSASSAPQYQCVVTPPTTRTEAAAGHTVESMFGPLAQHCGGAGAAAPPPPQSSEQRQGVINAGSEPPPRPDAQERVGAAEGGASGSSSSSSQRWSSSSDLHTSTVDGFLRTTGTKAASLRRKPHCRSAARQRYAPGSVPSPPSITPPSPPLAFTAEPPKEAQTPTPTVTPVASPAAGPSADPSQSASLGAGDIQLPAGDQMQVARSPAAAPLATQLGGVVLQQLKEPPSALPAPASRPAAAAPSLASLAVRCPARTAGHPAAAAHRASAAPAQRRPPLAPREVPPPPRPAHTGHLL